ncbi:hypothetical protein CM1200mP19_2240 [bacterium]|nr:MAG: hypothetical protein CM1200mP19_2240 [bacterium]
MKRTASRLVYTVIVLFVSSIAVFYAIRLSGGDATAAALPGSATEEFREEFRDRLGLNEPIYQQYFTYMGRILSGDPGNSLTNNKALTDMLTEHGRNSLVLGGTAFGLVFLSVFLSGFSHPSDAIVGRTRASCPSRPSLWLCPTSG